MRERKYKAWEKNKKLMSEDFCPFWNSDQDLMTVPVFTETISEKKWEAYSRELDSQDIVILEYTPFEDKNGKEICENDIVKVAITDGPEGGEYIMPVKYVNNGFYCRRHIILDTYIAYDFSETSKWEDGNASGWHKVNYEIIGNIHENPELLGAKTEE